MWTSRALRRLHRTNTSSLNSSSISQHQSSLSSISSTSCSCRSFSSDTDKKTPTFTHSSTISASSTIPASTRESAAAAIDKRIDKLSTPEKTAKNAHKKELQENVESITPEPVETKTPEKAAPSLDAILGLTSSVKTTREKNPLLNPTITYMGGPYYEERCKQYCTLYTPNNTVHSHTPEDIGRYYQISKQLLARIPQHLTQALREELGTTGEYLMIRQTAWDVVQQLRTIEKSLGTQEKSLAGMTIAIKGQRGCGKTATLHYAAQYAREQNWLLLSTYGQEFMTDPYGFIKPSTIKPKTYDQPIFTVYWFRKLLLTERETLRKIKLSKSYDYNWSFQQVVHPPNHPGLFTKHLAPEFDEPYSSDHSTLLDMVLLAAKDVDQAPRILYDFIHEIQIQTSVPVLVLIDNFNFWNQVTEFLHPNTNKSRVIARDLAMVSAFDELVNRPPISGATLWAPTSIATPKFERLHLARAHKIYDAKRYDDSELQQAITHYHISKLLLTQFDERWIYRVKAICGGVGRDVFEDACLT